MPVAQARHVKTATRLALFALLIPIGLALTEIPSGGMRPVIRLGALLVVAVALGVVLRRHAAFEEHVIDQARVGDELRASEAKFSGILSIAADANISVDESQKIIHFNRGAEEIFGYASAEAVGRPLEILIPPRFRQVHVTHMKTFVESPVVARRMGERREIFGLRHDGTEFPAEASISKLQLPGDRTGKRMLFTVVLRDITERKRAEQDERFLTETGAQLARSLDYEKALQTIADLPIPRLADAAVLDVIEHGGGFRRAVRTFQRIALTQPLQEIAAHPLSGDSPFPAVDVIRRRTSELVSPIDDTWLESSEDADAVAAWQRLGAHSLLILPLMAGDEVYGALTLIAVDPARRFNADLRALAETFANTAALTLQNARLYAAAQRANEARDEVLGVVSHDLRNPISAIAMCARVLRHSEPADAAARSDLLLTISESTDWMNRLIQDLLDVANIERGQLSLERRKELPTGMIDQAIHMFSVEAADHGIALESEVDPALPPVWADAARIVQVLGNLLRNAIKFTPNSGRITVRAGHRDGFVSLSVTDTGSGIPTDAQRHIFDRYWHSSDGARRAGTGLGLSIAKGIVEAHGGRIWVESAPARGSTFTFTLPVTTVQKPVADVESKKGP
jgi:PAS domain S-box-containing protein